MSIQSNNVHHASVQDVELLLEQEKKAVETYWHEAAHIEDPALKTLFKRLAELRARCCAELESHMTEAKSQNVIVGQINEMFW
ncbi:MAG: DUF2383 domain-containing protein [Ignavibacteria bacterium]|nr:DUF2383 domain-containing protein [Ignavibacteria bacterium]